MMGAPSARLSRAHSRSCSTPLPTKRWPSLCAGVEAFGSGWCFWPWSTTAPLLVRLLVHQRALALDLLGEVAEHVFEHLSRDDARPDPNLNGRSDALQSLGEATRLVVEAFIVE